jgi:KDO2-lipid IV(A) lauroyltransferase
MHSRKNTSQSKGIAYYSILAVFRVLSLIPRSAGLILGDLLGRILFLVLKRRRNVVMDNLTRAFKHEKDRAEIGILVENTFKNLGRIIFELAWSSRLSKEELQKHITVKGLENYQKALEKNRGVLLISAHFGNFEILAYAIAIFCSPVNIVVRHMSYRPLNPFVNGLRTRLGSRTIPAKRSMRKILRALKKGQSVGTLIDQSVDWYEGVFVDFFGRRACTNKGLALIALKTEAPVVPVFLVWQGTKFVMEFQPELPLIKTGDRTIDIESNTQQYTRAIEKFIRRYPDQWFWVHNRWKTKPYHPWPNEIGS